MLNCAELFQNNFEKSEILESLAQQEVEQNLTGGVAEEIVW